MKAKKNLSYKGMSGKVGDQLVARKWKGVYVVGSVPQFPDKRTWSEKQEAHHVRFQIAASYAQSMIKDPEMLEIYEAEAEGKSMTAYNAALKDYMRPPRVYEIDLSKYSGAPGEEILIVALDDVRVTRVEVSIVVNGEILEQGEASQDDVVTPFWVYRTQLVNEHKSYTVRATATDLPGNQTTGEVEV